MIQTLSQQRIQLAHKLVNARDGKPEAVIYGRLCHRFPMMVMQGGLLSAVLFIDSKTDASGDSGSAHQAILKDVASILGFKNGKDLCVALAQEKDALTLMAHTREVLHTWVMMRRFAISILKVESSSDDEEASA